MNKGRILHLFRRPANVDFYIERRYCPPTS